MSVHVPSAPASCLDALHSFLPLPLPTCSYPPAPAPALPLPVPRTAGPAVFDIAAASVYMALALKPWIAAIVFITLSGYVPMTITLTEWRGKFRRCVERGGGRRSLLCAGRVLGHVLRRLLPLFYMIV